MKVIKPKHAFQFNFEEWAKLAAQDPDRFEARRARTLSDAIGRVPENRQLMLRRLQWKVDRVRELKTTPLAACIAITDMMWNTFHDLNRSYHYLAEQHGKKTPGKQDFAKLPKATILPFPSRNNQ
ncbi:MAG: DUF3135 domain-containing protein [Gammaproteobacteria bacterium]|nr:DUF3135 domain-containing protein [Gammaproteobacteria bacterium]MDH5654012.1 DUF3135 domain-containing protein [Gammaproteobacteria bacterium]